MEDMEEFVSLMHVAGHTLRNFLWMVMGCGAVCPVVPWCGLCDESCYAAVDLRWLRRISGPCGSGVLMPCG